ncbi:MAG: hypothetical protein CL693_10515 [Cellvibrionaceae bacterium]|nr:hypothetical protein [Cellvibrionaceae bacterium]|tara:strand:- start:32509 stop:33399 length:891 start_codon:yes stop_codon:yes gene_type:complete
MMHIHDRDAELLLARPFKLAFFDIDGTLLGLDGNYTERLKRAMQRFQKAGIKTAVASGRPKFAADFLIEELGLSDAGLFCTGAHLEDPKSDLGPMAEHSLSDSLVSDLLKAAKDLDLYTELCFRDDFFVEDWPYLGQLHSEHLRATPKKVPSMQDLIGSQPVLKLLFAVTEVGQHRLLYELEARFPAVVFAYAKMAAKPEWLFVSVISDQGCKNQGFDQLLAYHQVSAHETIAFGDAQSDKVFLQRAGVGVAMGNAADDIKAVADIETLPVWDDGVALVLERVLSLSNHRPHNCSA